MLIDKIFFCDFDFHLFPISIDINRRIQSINIDDIDWFPITVFIDRQDFLPDPTTDADLLFIFSSNISDFQRSLSSYLKFGSRHEDSSRFYLYQGRFVTQKSPPARFKIKTAFLIWNSCQLIVPSPVIFAWFARVLASNIWKTNKNAISTLYESSQRLVNFMALVFLNMWRLFVWFCRP